MTYEERREKFIGLAEPLIEFINEHCDGHSIIEINNFTAKLTEPTSYVTQKDYISRYMKPLIKKEETE